MRMGDRNGETSASGTTATTFSRFVERLPRIRPTEKLVKTLGVESCGSFIIAGMNLYVTFCFSIGLMQPTGRLCCCLFSITTN